MILALLLAAADPMPMSAVDAERAFAADAQELGYWTSFRKWAAPEAVMFMLQPVRAADYLKDRGDPPNVANWRTSLSFVSCDGSTAINTGVWTLTEGNQHGYFTTVWRRTGPDWRWELDSGDVLEEPRAATKSPITRTAACGSARPAHPIPPVAPDAKVGSGQSTDGTLIWSWSVRPNDDRRFVSRMWNGQDWEVVVDDSKTGE